MRWQPSTAQHLGEVPHPWGFTYCEAEGKHDHNVNIIICQKFWSVSGGHFIMHIFSSMRSREGISFFIMPPSYFGLVSPLNFWQVFMSCKALGLGLYLTHKQVTRLRRGGVFMHLGLIYQLRTNSPAFSPPYLLDPHPFLPLKLVTSFLPTYPTPT